MPTTGITVFVPHVPLCLLGTGGSAVLALLPVVGKCFIGCSLWLPDRLWDRTA